MYSTSFSETGLRVGLPLRMGRLGFTLLEVMVAVAVLGIALTALHYGQAQGIRAQARAQNVILASMKAMEKMQEANFTRFQELLPRAGETTEGDFEPPYEFLHWTLRVEENEYTPEILNVFLTVTWDTETTTPGKKSIRRPSGEPGSGRSLTVCFYRAASLR